MELKDYSTEELKAELKRRSDLAKAKKAKVKRCRMCKHWGGITHWGTPNDRGIYGLNRSCKYQKHESGKYYKAISAYQAACEHFEEK